MSMDEWVRYFMTHSKNIKYKDSKNYIVEDIIRWRQRIWYISRRLHI